MKSQALLNWEKTEILFPHKVTPFLNFPKGLFIRAGSSDLLRKPIMSANFVRSDAEGILCLLNLVYKSWFAWLSPCDGERDRSLIPGLNPLRATIMSLENVNPCIGCKFCNLCFIFFWLFCLGECLAKILVALWKYRAHCSKPLLTLGIRKTLVL